MDELGAHCGLGSACCPQTIAASGSAYEPWAGGAGRAGVTFLDDSRARRTRPRHLGGRQLENRRRTDLGDGGLLSATEIGVLGCPIGTLTTCVATRAWKPCGIRPARAVSMSALPSLPGCQARWSCWQDSGVRIAGARRIGSGSGHRRQERPWTCWSGIAAPTSPARSTETATRRVVQIDCRTKSSRISRSTRRKTTTFERMLRWR
jgi:hypothetical protein